MKAFLLGVAFAVGMAVVSGFVLEDFLAREADASFAAPSVRLGENGSLEHRNFSGEVRR
jgi:hypothetical protein